jgi:hypothetical protein
LAKQEKSSAKTQQKKSLQIPAENKYFTYGMLAAFLLLVFFSSSYKISGDDDFFWHLATGRFIVENKYVPDKDVFGYASANDEWMPFEWGWDILSYGLYNIGGNNAILIFRSLAFVFIFFLLYLLLRKFRINSLLTIVLLFSLLVGVMDRLSPRPHIITYIFFVTISFILLSFKYLDREKYFKRLYFLPLIFLIWGNSHMGVLAGGLFLFIFTVSELLIYYKPSMFSSPEIKPLTNKQMRTLFIISVVCALVLLVNPHGLSTYIYAYSHTKMKMLETVNEWRSPFTGVMDFGFVITFYKIFLFSGFIVLLYAYTKKDIFFALVVIGFAIYSVRAVRFTVDYEILALFFIAVSFNYYLNKLKGTSPKSFTNKLLTSSIPKVIILFAFIYLITLIPENKIYQSLKYYRISGWGINDEFIPVQLFDFMKENNITGNTYNQFGTGGYLVWNFPGQKNFIDSRNLNDRLFNEYQTIMFMKPGFEKKLEQYGIDYVIYLDPDLIRRTNDLQSIIISYLNKNPDWKLVFWDDKSFLFVKNVPKFADVIKNNEYRVLNPYTALFNKAEFEKKVKASPQRTKDELNRKARTDPQGNLYRGLNEMTAKYLQGL